MHGRSTINFLAKALFACSAKVVSSGARPVQWDPSCWPRSRPRKARPRLSPPVALGP